MSVVGPVEAPVWGGESRLPPALPENWYALAEGAEVRPGKLLATRIGTREVVLMRSPNGQRLTAFAAHCAHMGCHLRHGRVEAEGLRCALHERLISPEGPFVTPEGRPSHSLVQKTYPVAELFGLVFVWLGAGAPPPLPMPRTAEGEGFAARPAGRFDTTTDWTSLIANGFDMEHLAVVHRRRLIEDATVTRPTADSFRLSYRSRVTGTRITDRIVRYLSGNEVHASMTSWRGSMMLVESRLGRRRSFFVLSLCPTPEGGTVVRSAVGILREKPGLLEGLRLRLTARMFKLFLSDDFRVLTDLRWHPPVEAHGEPDRDSQRLAQFFLSLRGAEP